MKTSETNFNRNPKRKQISKKTPKEILKEISQENPDGKSQQNFKGISESPSNGSKNKIKCQRKFEGKANKNF